MMINGIKKTTIEVQGSVSGSNTARKELHIETFDDSG